jgi:hypothetical protein
MALFAFIVFRTGGLERAAERVDELAGNDPVTITKS